MARQSLGALLGNVEDKTPAPPPPAVNEPGPGEAKPPEVVPEASPVAQSTPPTPSQGRPRSPRPKPPIESELPTYLRLVRKETRLREDQQDQLTLHARRLNRAKAAGTPRITDNSLIRVAVDLLLARIEKVSGDDERAILESLNQ